MLNPRDVQAIIIEQAREDAYALYEIIGLLNTKYPSIPESAKIAAARAALRSLLDAGKIRLYWERWASSIPLDLVPEEQIPSVLDDPAAWQPGSRYVCFMVPEGPGRVV